ncbi:unnamed protein product [Arctia plantaginis]|uniref:Uncharacterized protein n=1 Tax=Arctia plantaginis TaxID=874455 RepID=A0A8S1B5R3_ARCPL|nr:unnamed protein product [Arctia plantaginis]
MLCFTRGAEAESFPHENMNNPHKWDFLVMISSRRVLEYERMYEDSALDPHKKNCRDLPTKYFEKFSSLNILNGNRT